MTLLKALSFQDKPYQKNKTDSTAVRAMGPCYRLAAFNIKFRISSSAHVIRVVKDAHAGVALWHYKLAVMWQLALPEGGACCLANC